MENNRHNRTLGREGEDISCRYLVEQGHIILDRNWRAGHLEIDIVSMDRVGIHFVEVKSRSVPFEASPQESVTRIKQKRLSSAAKGYISRKGRTLPADLECHFDIVAVVFDRDRTQIRFFPDAFIPGI